LQNLVSGVARHVGLGLTERIPSKQIISGEIVGWVVAFPSVLIHMVRARPPWNHGEEIHMVVCKQTLVDMEEWRVNIVLKTTGASLWTREAWFDARGQTSVEAH
jgi:hypothetical protein